MAYDQIKLCKDLKSARIRIGLMGLFHFLVPPAASLVYAIKTHYWTPFILATIVGIGTALISTVATTTAGADPGASFLTSFMISSALGLIPMAISFFIYQARAMNVRARNSIILPEQADRMLAEAMISASQQVNQP